MTSEKPTAAQAGTREDQTETSAEQAKRSMELDNMLAAIGKFIVLLRALRTRSPQRRKKLTRTERRHRNSFFELANLVINVGVITHRHGDERALDLVAGARTILVEVSAIFGLKCDLPSAAEMLA